MVMKKQRTEPMALLWVLVIVTALAACGPAPTSTPQGEPPSATEVPGPTSPPEEALPPTVAPTPEAAAPGDSPLPADPLQIEFEAQGGRALVGTYYPATVSPAPLVVLMHWALGDQREWAAVARWLQNRGLAAPDDGAEEAPWLDPSWFPPMPEGRSFAVFTFTFRGCEGGCSSFDREGWLLDALAAMETARGLQGVDPERVAAIGASVGGDGAIDACGEGCLGALSFSPGSYLRVTYADAVAAIADAAPAWCLAAEGDSPSAQACSSASGAHYRTISYPGDEHGMMLIRPGMDPDPLAVVLDFLQQVFG
jgi:dienelactone hydrolase